MRGIRQPGYEHTDEQRCETYPSSSDEKLNIMKINISFAGPEESRQDIMRQNQNLAREEEAEDERQDQECTWGKIRPATEEDIGEIIGEEGVRRWREKIAEQAQVESHLGEKNKKEGLDFETMEKAVEFFRGMYLVRPTGYRGDMGPRNACTPHAQQVESVQDWRVSTRPLWLL